MKTELKKYVKNADLMLSHMKFSESDFATVIEINVIKYNAMMRLGGLLC